MTTPEERIAEIEEFVAREKRGDHVSDRYSAARLLDATVYLLERVEELEGRVEAAFREGYRYGFDAGELGASYYGNRSTMDADEAWDESDARQALEAEGESDA